MLYLAINKLHSEFNNKQIFLLYLLTKQVQLVYINVQIQLLLNLDYIF